MNSAMKKYLQQGGNLDYLLALCFETLAHWQEEEQKRHSDVNIFNIEYFKGFIDYIKQNKEKN